VKDLKREKRLLIEVRRPTTLAVLAEDHAFLGQPAARRTFWAAVAGAQEERGVPTVTPDDGENAIVQHLATKLASKAAGVHDVKVGISGYGSITLAVTWLGPDIGQALGDWVVDCLEQLFGVGFVLVDSGDDKQAGTLKSLQAILTAALPKHPLVLLFVLLFALGLTLVEKSWSTFERLIDQRTTLVEKLETNSQAIQNGYQAVSSTYRAIGGSTALATDAGPGTQ
jgi:hypothetical protein